MGFSITLSTPPSAFEVGTYELELANVEEKVFDQFVGEGLYGPDNGHRFVWTWVDPQDETAFIEQLTTTSTGPKSKTFEVLTAILGPDALAPGKKFDLPDLIGKTALVSIGQNDKGYPRVEKVTAKPRARTRPAPAAAAPSEEGLPF